MINRDEIDVSQNKIVGIPIVFAVAKCPRLPSKAIPTAKAIAPKMATKEVVSIPNILATLNNNKIFKPTLTKEHRKGRGHSFINRLGYPSNYYESKS